MSRLPVVGELARLILAAGTSRKAVEVCWGNLAQGARSLLGEPPGSPRPPPPVRFADGRYAPLPDPLHRSASRTGATRLPQTPSTGPVRGQPRACRVAIDGVDAAGKSTLASELAARLAGSSRLSADDFLRRPEERYRQGRESPVGYFEDSFDHGRLRRAVLASDGLLLVDGIFLFRDELNDLWDFRIFVKIELEESIRRGIARDGREKEELYRRRYAPAQRRYLEDVRPAELANVVVDNTDVTRPSISLGRASSR